ncbi:MAG: PHP domain-containing protein [bacterium]|nr:PHP domain-containing protein [bacterium]
MDQQLWNVELHSHTQWSKDCIVSLEKLVSVCAARGIDRIAITDHNTADGALAMQKIAPDLVIVGEEIMTTHGELLGYFVQESIPAGLSPHETIRRLREQGAVISVSHPYDRLRKGAWEETDLLAILDQVDAIEIFNARCLYRQDNAKAINLARERNLIGTVGSDAHTRGEYGLATMHMEPFEGASSFVESLRAAQGHTRLNYSHPVVHVHSKTAKWGKKLGLRSRLWEGG